MKRTIVQGGTAPDLAAAGFSADWLQQREPFDAAARDAAAPRLALAERLAALRPQSEEPWRVIDLACGTGANLRWLASHLGGAQQWLALDHDLALLQRWPLHLAAAGDAAESHRSSASALHEPLPHAGPGFQASIVRQPLDLATALSQVPWASAHWVTASAFLDLVSAAWLQRLVHQVAATRLALLLALNVDGRHVWSMPDADDALVASLFAAHQQRDKGFGGPALGAAAAPALAKMLRAAGYRVFRERSDWLLHGATDSRALALQRALIDGMASAASEQQRDLTATVEAWRQRRLVLAARSTLRVGHTDLLALPPR